MGHPVDLFSPIIGIPDESLEEAEIDFRETIGLSRDELIIL